MRSCRAWRAATATEGSNGDCANLQDARSTGVGGGAWYRFEGAGGDALPLTPPGYRQCGTEHTGWLSGLDGVAGSGVAGAYTTAGRYPASTEGVVEMIVCFNGGPSVTVGVVRCGGFLLWRLPYAQAGGSCDTGYCTVPSGL